jgi:hypothetical protein
MIVAGPVWGLNGKTGDRYAAKAFKRAGDRGQKPVLYADELSAYQHGTVLPCAVVFGLVFGDESFPSSKFKGITNRPTVYYPYKASNALQVEFNIRIRFDTA